MNATIEKLIAEYGEKPDTGLLNKSGWRILNETHVTAKPEYTNGKGKYELVWPAGFSELLDGRVVYRGYYGHVLLAPDQYQPAVIADEGTKRALYAEAMSG